MSGFTVKDSGKREEYPSGMRRDTQEDKPDYTLIDYTFLTRLATHLTKGAEKYGRDNWTKANSEAELTRFKSSALRHMIQWLSGNVEEDHAMAVCFNIMAGEYVKGKLPKPFAPIEGEKYVVEVVDSQSELVWYANFIGTRICTEYKGGKYFTRQGWLEPEDIRIIARV